MTHQLLVLLIIGYIVYTIDIKKNFFPVPVVLVAIGLGLSFIPYFDEFNISKEIIFNVFLPAMLFTAAYQFPLKQLKRNIGIIVSLSTIGLILTVVLLGLAIYFAGGVFTSLSLTAAFLLAAILTPTDPISVTAILKESNGAEQIADVVEGESMINDGTSIVFFTIFLTMYQTGNGFSLGKFISELLLVSIGGVVLGIAIGWLMSKTIRFTQDKQYQVMLSVIGAYGAFYIGEAIGVSGVLATVAAGVFIAYEMGRNIKEDTLPQSLNGFWDIVTPILLAVLFLLIGMRGAEYLAFSGWWFAFAIFLLTIIVRFIVIALFIYGVPKWRDEFKNDFSTITLTAWSGIKGAMSIALLLWLEETAPRQDHMLISLAFAVILLSLAIQSIGIYPLSKVLKKFQ
ncbi:sodium:proton antiporter [Planococcus sp. CP5-4]|uniref:cation:proton antiporter n=1 Tax=unclassified Planococcus (in: firmicutes) TaxID=2662419 RepID=UPI001C210163|nr:MULTISPECIES: sodium:proton antiporter [unclassified Planococcus (in: firmicutes)]MBU9673583.1 sodium:proton antiporter [Planococcus sp. CP5-4_YE]MBV0907873.1 sodium:proton antiporter [Planococcus sp. CP5-4_UN]MBW6063040.1 sodium:proton antiporter [Planococcus sp. CP5-4]